MSITLCLSPSTRAVPSRGSSHQDYRAVIGLTRPVSKTPNANAESRADLTSVLDDTPVEVFVEIFKHLDLQGAFSLARTCRRFAAIFAAHRTSILLPIVEEEFSPFSGLLQVVKASPNDLAVPWGTWLDKRVSRNNGVLCEGGKVPEDAAVPPGGITCKNVVFEGRDMDRMLEICKVVRGWERIFPQHRFHDSPLATRSLVPQENERLRRALYNWMRYAFYFHGDLPRPNLYEPAGNDPRVNQLRAMSNSELRGLRDLWLTVEDIVAMKLCPSVPLVRIETDFEMDDKVAARIGWGEQSENERVVQTVCKLSPGELLHYIDNVHEYPKAKLIRAIRQRHPQFEADTQSLGTALECVTFERYGRAEAEFPSAVTMWLPMYARVSGVPGDGGGGILDWENPESEVECAKIGEMTGFGLTCRSWEPVNVVRETRTGLLDV